MSRQAVVPLVAGVLVDRPVGLRHRIRHGPRPRPRRRIVDREAIVERVGVDAREALDEVQILARSAEVRPVGEVRRVDDQRVALPAAARVAHPRAEARGEMRTAVERNDARVVDHLGEEQSRSSGVCTIWRLLLYGTGQHHFRQAARDAALHQAPVLVGVGRPVRSGGGAARGRALLPLRRQRRDLAVRRIDDQRGARVLTTFLP